jgi:hypothetical protein
MERLAQYLDDLEDLFFALGLLLERVRRAMQLGLVLIVSMAVQFLGILLALSRPPLALAFVCLTIVGMLYRAVTGNHPVQTPVH